jgi:DegV family protein with EDD domain
MSNSVAIVTESTCDLPHEIAHQRNIHVVPQYVIWGNESFRDGIDLTSEAFYQRLATDKLLPKTSQPSPGDFVEAYRKAREAANADTVICLTLSAELSGSYNSAVQAAEAVDFPVRVIDTRVASLPHGFMALTAADARDAGLPPTEIEEAIREAIPKSNVYFTVGTLEFLHRGGRIGGAQRLIGDTLKIRPILTVVDGKIEPKETVRTRKRVTERMLDLVGEIQQAGSMKRLGVIQAQAREEAEMLYNLLDEKYHPETLLTSHACAAVGVHVGPGCLGIAYQLN